MLRLAGRTRETMGEFLERATQQKIDRLSALITESFRFLLRKQTLVERILIHPSTFAVTLYDSEGQAIPRQRLIGRGLRESHPQRASPPCVYNNWPGALVNEKRVRSVKKENLPCLTASVSAN